MKAEALAYFGKGDPLVRFFGLFYAGTGFAAFLIQAALGRLALTRLGLAGPVASHPGRSGPPAFSASSSPAPGGASCRGPSTSRCAPRSSVRVRAVLHAAAGVDQTLRQVDRRRRRRLLRERRRRRADPMFTILTPRFATSAVNVSGVIAAGAELFVARRLRPGYVAALEGGLGRQRGASSLTLSTRWPTSPSRRASPGSTGRRFCARSPRRGFEAGGTPRQSRRRGHRRSAIRRPLAHPLRPRTRRETAADRRADPLLAESRSSVRSSPRYGRSAPAPPASSWTR